MLQENIIRTTYYVFPQHTDRELCFICQLSKRIGKLIGWKSKPLVLPQPIIADHSHLEGSEVDFKWILTQIGISNFHPFPPTVGGYKLVQALSVFF